MNATRNSIVTLILPVRKAGAQLDRCLQSILAGTVVPEIIVMDCTGMPGALDQIRTDYPQVRVFGFGMNPGRAHAVNTGIHIARTPYVITFSQELIAGKHCVERLCQALDEDSNLMSVQARIMSSDDHSRISGAGWSLSYGTHPVIRGKGAKASYIKSYLKRTKITAAQMEAAAYRMEYLEVAGIFDERYYGWLEDLDLGYRGILCGFDNLYEPQAVCREMRDPKNESPDGGDGKSLSAGKRTRRFYSQLETGNMVYFRYKFGIESVSERLGGILAALRPVRRNTDTGSAAAEPDTGSETDAAVERGRMLCFQAEMELMEREELGMSVTKQTLPEEFCLRVREDGPENVYPLYLGERIGSPYPDLRGTFRVNAVLMAGTGEKLKSFLRVPFRNF